jgi:uncharacterized membrane protein YphA (DoxX/SURF4 family)
MILGVLAVVSGAAFVRYGVRVLREPHLEAEFRRYGIPDARHLVGVLEILGGVGVVVGLALPLLGAAAAAGLTTLMVLGLAVRVRLRDTVRQMLPAATLATLNAALVVLFVNW